MPWCFWVAAKVANGLIFGWIVAEWICFPGNLCGVFRQTGDLAGMVSRIVGEFVYGGGRLIHLTFEGCFHEVAGCCHDYR